MEWKRKKRKAAYQEATYVLDLYIKEGQGSYFIPSPKHVRAKLYLFLGLGYLFAKQCLSTICWVSTKNNQVSSWNIWDVSRIKRPRDWNRTRSNWQKLGSSFPQLSFLANISVFYACWIISSHCILHFSRLRMELTITTNERLIVINVSSYQLVVQWFDS